MPWHGIVFRIYVNVTLSKVLRFLLIFLYSLFTEKSLSEAYQKPGEHNSQMRYEGEWVFRDLQGSVQGLRVLPQGQRDAWTCYFRPQLCVDIAANMRQYCSNSYCVNIADIVCQYSRYCVSI